MGAKGIKAIVLDDSGMSVRKPKKPEEFKAANKVFVQGLQRLARRACINAAQGQAIFYALNKFPALLKHPHER